MFCAMLLPVFSIAAQIATPVESITLRFIDYRSGKPITKVSIFVKGYNGRLTGRVADSTTIFSTWKKTDKEGKITIRLPRELPQRIYISSFDLWASSPSFILADVLSSGAVAPYRNSDELPKLNVTSKPGEIIILNRKLTAWDKTLREIP